MRNLEQAGIVQIDLNGRLPEPPRFLMKRVYGHVAIATEVIIKVGFFPVISRANIAKSKDKLPRQPGNGEMVINLRKHHYRDPNNLKQVLVHGIEPNHYSIQDEDGRHCHPDELDLP